jgi:hypothetical protein
MDRYLRLVDPDAATLQEAIRSTHQEMYEHLDETPPELPSLDFPRQQPFGVMLHRADGDDTSLALLIARWSDPLGRSHWAIGVDDGSRTFLGPEWPEEDKEWFLTGEHPLLYLGEPLTTAYLRRLDGAWHLRVGCRCGVVGSPESIGWLGQQCGPCWDREQEGEPRPVAAINHSIDSLLTVRHQGWITAAHDAQRRLLQCRDPHSHALRWSQPLDGLQRVTANEHQVVARGLATVWCLDPRSGDIQATIEAGANLKAAVPLGDDRVVTLHPRGIKFWRHRPEPLLLQSVPLRHPAHWHLAVLSGAQRIAVCTTGGIETFDARGTPGERYVAQPPGAIDYAEWLPEGGLLGVRRTGHSARLYRWQSDDAPPGGFLSRLLGRDGIAPLAQSLHDDCRHLRVTPCGQYALYTGSNNDITLVETRTLQGVARVQFARRSQTLLRDLHLGLASDGRVVLSDGRQLVAYLWQELFDRTGSV